MKNQIYFLSYDLTLVIIFSVSILFAVTVGIIYSKKHQGIENYLTANRNIGVTSLTTEFSSFRFRYLDSLWTSFSSYLGRNWICNWLFFGHIFPNDCTYFFRCKNKKDFSKRQRLLQNLFKRKFGNNLFKLVLVLMIFYMFIFLCAEVTAISILINYISGTSLWITALLVIVATLAYTLYGGLKASILTDNFQFFIVLIFLLIFAFYIFSFNSSEISLDLIKNNSNHLISSEYLPNYTAGLNFFHSGCSH